MTKQQLALLGICNFVIYVIIAGLTGLLPVYLTQFDADSTITGFYLAFAFLLLAISNVVGGWLADRLQQRKLLLMLGGALASLVTLLMSQSTNVGQLTLLTGCLWFFAGVVGTMVNILAGLFAQPHHRGWIFGILGLCITFGSFCGGLVSGVIVDQWGFTALFVLAALFCLIVPLAGLFVHDTWITKASTTPGIFINRAFLFLFFASILAHTANSEILLTRPLIMHHLKFDATAISQAAGMGALFVLPLPLLIGSLSDRLGRKPFLILCYLTTVLGLMILMTASEVWHFWAASAFQSALGVSVIVGSALIADQTSKGSSLSLFTATPWIGFVVGFSGGGAAISAFQMTQTLVFGVILTLTAILLLIPIRR